jgi:cell division protein DivIC
MDIILRSRARLFFVVCLAVAGYFAYVAVAGAIQNERLAEDRANAQQQLAELEWKKQCLEAVKRYVASDAYVEQEARRRLGYIRDGEVPFVVNSPSLPATEASGSDWWERLFPGCAGS